ncbi:DUF2627 domain-containing protein [Kyrpidia spormannii]|uniref:DUF2627 domain-containing protein n=3 Tax=Kyrpidia TaxID=1129704 RepID=A0A2K8N7B5_9BACL|nr:MULTISPECIES: DUF2627 domain-containing protein [Kyrpidia]ADG06029.1 hypothetical protein Btus_1306 [Kyrpidia tusciae DSM 2912]ATY85173.1 DUF2627 domain-containing protein [Kyrpidia spormannii]MCL6575724.1 DUF2627 family protein [Kyrpidia sp.]CAB3392860.1 conserved protein of unknown function [Kyrpidia spormannii]CAB3393776.1 conserved protein of unknown function [Kyrpidia spormannii]
MGLLISWIILIGFFLLGGYGVTLVRDAVMGHLFNPSQPWLGPTLAGTVLIAISVGFLGGFIYYREKKRGKVKGARRGTDDPPSPPPCCFRSG